MLINLRNALMAGKRTPTAKDYVQNGLVAMWDGIENAGWGTHDASAGTWKDLVGGFDAVKIGSPTFTDNAGVTDGTSKTFDSTIPTSSAFIQAAKSGPVTIEMCLSTTWSWNSRCPLSIEDSSGDSSAYRFLQIFMQSTKMYRGAPYNINGTAFVGTNTEATSPSGTFSFVCWYENGRAYGLPYFDGTGGTQGNNNIAVFNPANIDTFGISNWHLRIGRTHNNSMGASFHRIALYSRALTASEIAANYAIDKERFNLP